jgi:hypothetical protein
MFNGNRAGVILWSLGAMGAGSFLLMYVLISIRRGWLNAGKPPGDVYRSKQLAEFWAGVILLGLFGGVFLIFGLLVLTRRIVFHGT